MVGLLPTSEWVGGWWDYSLLVSGWVGGGINSPQQQKKNFVDFGAHLCNGAYMHDCI